MKTIGLVIVLSFILFSVPARADLWQENGTTLLSSGAISWGIYFPAGDLKLETKNIPPMNGLIITFSPAGNRA